MKIINFYTLPIFILLLILCSSGQKSVGKHNKLTIRDKSEILQLTLSKGIEDLFKSPESPKRFNECLIPIVEDRQVIFLLSKNIKALTLPDIDNYSIKLFTPEEMFEQSKQGEQCHFEVSDFKTRNKKVLVSLWRKINLPVGLVGDVVYRGGIAYSAGVEYEFSKISGKWKIKLIGKL